MDMDRLTSLDRALSLGHMRPTNENTIEIILSNAQAIYEYVKNIKKEEKVNN